MVAETKKTTKAVEETTTSTVSDDAKTTTSKKRSNDDDDDTGRTAKARIKAKKAELKSLLAQVPTHDENGICYTKSQIRRMTKRVKHGLPAVPTEAENQQRTKEMKEDRKRDEDELAGTIYERDSKKKKRKERESAAADKEGDATDDEKNDETKTTDPTVTDDEEGEPPSNGIEGSNDETTTSSPSSNPDDKPVATTLKKVRCLVKPVPSDYVCYACNNEIAPAHWIYNCPRKKKRVGERSNDDDDKSGSGDVAERSVFASGLPFESTGREVEDFFETECDGELESCKLLTFADTGRCKGCAFLVFRTARAAKAALDLAGSDKNVVAAAKPNPKQKRRKGNEAVVPKVPKLKVVRTEKRSKSRKKRRTNARA